MDRLVSVDLKELEIEYRPSRRCRSSTFIITNLMHTMSVAIHLTTTPPSHLFSILPSNSHLSLSILPPLSSASFSLSLSPSSSSSSPPPISASLLVRSALLPTGTASSAALLRLFSLPGPHLFRDASLPIYLTGPHVLRSLLHSPSSETLDISSLISKAASSCSSSDLSSLLLAAAGSRPHILSALISAGADVNFLAPDGKPPITLAVLSGCPDSVSTLLSAGAKPNPDLIHAAAASGFAEIVTILVSAGSGRNPVDSTGRSPLHAAAAGGHLEAARVCVSVLGSDPDLADSAGWTPLHCAAFAGGPAELVEYLIGVSVFDARRALTRFGRKTAFELAVERGHEELYEALRPDEVGVMRGTCKGDVSELRSRGRDGVDRRDQNGWTALHRAAFKGRKEVVTALVEMGASVDAVDDGGFTPLQRAVEAGHGDVAMLLVRNGAARAGIKGLKGMEKWRGMLLMDDATCTVGDGDHYDDVDKKKIRNSFYLESQETRRGIEA
ncbi:26S proteasome regulatory complex subunit PSMD10 protein [Dioscorea alata]|uniref:26S proteasome regulatory complex subunit PSMD10 protein n=1 Tax=Dioscorea alata TaxID=55571 RepID=A0ACB7VQW6_DIOAL|nr:26S proteasome regulatory complex subunit PSMD10 protein [Dioscorea alata]